MNDELGEICSIFALLPVFSAMKGSFFKLL